MPDISAPTPRDETVTGARMREEGKLWPWIARFFWAPALDFHPGRRTLLLPGWPDAAWHDAGMLRHVSRHLLALISHAETIRWNSAASDFRLALLPSEPLSRLARHMGIALAWRDMNEDDKNTLDANELVFFQQRAPLYWRGSSPVQGLTWESTGWAAMRSAVAGQPEPVRARFDWKSPPRRNNTADLHEAAVLDTARPESATALQALAFRILREFEEPWSYLFATPAR